MYQYHSLFRDFLLTHGEKLLPTEAGHQQKRLAANAMLEMHRYDDAVTLLSSIGAWDNLVAVIVNQASSLCEHGRHQTLCEWICKVPDEVRAREPWLSFWLAESYLFTNEKEIRPLLQLTFDGFAADENRIGELLVASLALEAIHRGYSTYAEVDRWVEVVRTRFSSELMYKDKVEELRVYTALLLADCIFEVGELGKDAERIYALLEEDIDPNRRSRAACLLMDCYFLQSKGKEGRRLAAVAEPLLKSSALSPVSRAWWLNHLGMYFVQFGGEAEKGQAYLREAAEIGAKDYLHDLLVTIAMNRANIALFSRQAEGAKKLLIDTRPSVEKASPRNLLYYHRVGGSIALMLGDAADALYHAKEAVDIAERIQYPHGLRLRLSALLATALLLLKDFDQALCIIKKNKQILEATSQYLASSYVLGEAYVALMRGLQEEALALMGVAFPVLRRYNYDRFFAYCPAISATICEAAIDAHIEVEFVSRVAAKRNLLSPRSNWDDWPWPAKIYCLGSFQVVVNGRELTSTRKRPEKILELLQAIVALGGQDVPTDELIILLWPGDQRVGGNHALETTVYRLRRFLGDDTAVVVKKSSLSLNRERVWVDAWSLEATLDGIANGINVDLATFEATAQRIFNLYRGRVLAHASQKVKRIVSDENLWSKIRNFLLQFGRALETMGKYDQALDAYRFGIRHNPVDGDFYAAIIQTYIRLNRPREALDVYASCTHSFRTLINKEPTTELRKLAQMLSR